MIFRDDSSRLTTFAIVWLAVTFPLLAFPQVIWPWGRWIVAAIAVAALILATRLMIESRLVSRLVAVLAFTATIGWFLAVERETALSHFGGIAAGVLSMATVAVWCRTQARLLFAGSVFLLFGLFALGVGLSGTSIHSGKLITFPIDALPQLHLPLPGLSDDGWINSNALGVTGLMILPVAAAFCWLPRDLFSGQQAIRLLAMVTTVTAAAVVVITQSRSVWAAAWLTLLVAFAQWRSLGRWRFVAMAVVIIVPTAVLLSLRGQDEYTIQMRFLRTAQSIGSRVDIWRQGVTELAGSPVFGIGLNEFRHVHKASVGPEGKPEAHVHNVFLQTALDLGLVGVGAYVILLGNLLWKADRQSRGPDRLAGRVAAGAGLSLIGVHAFGLGDAVALGAKVGLFQWLASGFVLAAWRMNRAGSAP